MAKYLIITLALVACALGDDGYAAPAGGYASPPQEAYGSPQPAYDGYGAPDVAQPAYEAAPSYDYDNSADAASVGGDLFDLNKILELLPLFLAVFAAIIVAQLFAPLLGMLFGVKLGAANALLAPLGPAKIGLMNAILAPFGLVLANLGSTGGALTAAGRSLAEGFTMRSSPEMVSNVADFLYNAIQAYEH